MHRKAAKVVVKDILELRAGFIEALESHFGKRRLHRIHARVEPDAFESAHTTDAFPLGLRLAATEIADQAVAKIERALEGF